LKIEVDARGNSPRPVIRSPPGPRKKGKDMANEGKRRTRAKDKERGDVNEGPNCIKRALYNKGEGKSCY